MGYVILTILTYLLYGFAKSVHDRIVDIAGDAARYLDITPKNVGERQEIIAHSINLLQKLQSDKRYNKIIVVAHSLGSIIAYDALKHSWAETQKDNTFDMSILEEKASVDKLILQSEEDKAWNHIQEAQKDLFKLLSQKQGKKNIWKVTDFISVGSPLVHAPLLLAGTKKKFETQKDKLELPVCPPRRTKEIDIKGKFEIDKAGLFVVTRWTNIFFNDDPIGGPLKGLFGKGVKDIELDSGLKKRKWESHTQYWSPSKGNGYRVLGKRSGRYSLLRSMKKKNVMNEHKKELNAPYQFSDSIKFAKTKVR